MFFVPHKEREKGQAIVVIFILMTLALSVGIGVATRFVKNLRMSERVDISARSVAIAEAGIERLLLLPYETLADYIQYSSCGTDCYLEVTGDDGVVATATVTLSHLGASSDPFLVSLSTTETREVDLDGYPTSANAWVCWNDAPSGETASVTGLYFHGTRGSYGVDNFAYNPVGSTHIENGFDNASANLGYSHCFSILSKDDSKMLRLKSVYNDADVFIIPAPSEELPSQGILLESVGEVDDVEKIVRVVKSNPFLPGYFDYVLYSKSQEEPLAN